MLVHDRSLSGDGFVDACANDGLSGVPVASAIARSFALVRTVESGVGLGSSPRRLVRWVRPGACRRCQLSGGAVTPLEAENFRALAGELHLDAVAGIEQRMLAVLEASREARRLTVAEGRANLRVVCADNPT